jgi:hypothetical protein
MYDHFRQPYFEIHAVGRLPCSKPKMMNYSNMAMVWAEIMLYKEVDWCTIYRRNMNRLNWGLWMIVGLLIMGPSDCWLMDDPTNWMGPSDCWPR